MGVNTSSLTALFFTGLLGTASAATLPVNADIAASIYGRDVRSEFLPGAYVIAPGATDGGLNAQSSSVSQDVPVYRPLVLSKAAALTGSGSLSSNTSDPGASGSQGGNGGSVDPVATSDGASIESSPTRVGPVPLPPALPMFGAAVLGLAAFGWSRKRQAAKL